MSAYSGKYGIQLNGAQRNLKYMQAMALQYYLTLIGIGPWNSLMMHVPKLPNVHVYLHRGLFFLAGWAENPIMI